MAGVCKSSDVIKICHVNIRCLPRIVPANLWQVLQVVKMISNMHKSSIDEKVTAYNNLVLKTILQYMYVHVYVQLYYAVCIFCLVGGLNDANMDRKTRMPHSHIS